MTTNTNPSAQPVSDGEPQPSADFVYKCDGFSVPIRAVYESLTPLDEECFSAYLLEVQAQSYQSGYAAAVGDAVACAPKERQPAAKDHELIKTCDHHNVDFDNSIRLQNYSYNYGINEYRTNIEKLLKTEDGQHE